jgi:signal transduction histidine kinase
MCLLILWVFTFYYYHRKKKRTYGNLEIEKVASGDIYGKTENYFRGQDDERQRIAKELHDGACSALLGVRMLIEPYVKTNKDLAKATEWLRSIHSDLRHMSHNLAANELFDRNLADAIELVLERHCSNVGIKFSFTSVPSVNWQKYPRQLQQNIYRSVQELICNTVKHSNATLMAISLNTDGERLGINIEDDSTNFETHRHNGLGLESIESRIKAVGGSFEACKTPQGVVYRIEA